MKKTRAKEIEEVRAMWDEQAKKHGASPLATTHDRLLRDLEVNAVIKYLPSKKQRVIDIGCGNGYSTIEYAKVRKGSFIGIDFSQQMITEAQKALRKTKHRLSGSVEFAVGDILNLEYPDESFDTVTTGRCLVNMVSIEDQKKALLEIKRVLKKGGHAILCEGSHQGFSKVNELRKLVGLPTMKYHWHNIYLDEETLVPFMRKHFKAIEIDAFASTYFIASRVFNALTSPDPKKPDYFSTLNKAAMKLPAIGDYSSLKVFYLTK